MILVTGGAGYIGSHTCVELARAGRQFAVLDNLCNSSRSAVDGIAQLTGAAVPFYEGDIRDEMLLERIFESHSISAVIHFAGLKSVAESVRQPIEYFDNNVTGSIKLLKAMRRVGCKTMVFSSSATVYGNATSMPITEETPRAAVNPYGQSKQVVEDLLRDLYASDPSWRIARLRYFNPVGAHESALIGERPQGTPNNLMPIVAQVAGGERPAVTVFGSDYPTPDGTGVRDYIHVMDLAEGHVAALDFLERSPQDLVLNLGTGRGTSVLEMIAAFERVSSRKIPVEMADRRPGDVPVCYADVSRAEQLIGWKARRNVEDMCRDSWRWQVSSAE
ncbi:UDP-glucose 4-epimerase GalE [Variovorax ureilyticus]|uniref:UDP-glucose 4-epimerase GalE n=1 Tax=Variovorax ureilyticus TaxID=1836198 RepID=UPI003D667FC3